MQRRHEGGLKGHAGVVVQYIQHLGAYIALKLRQDGAVQIKNALGPLSGLLNGVLPLGAEGDIDVDES
jgi:hypothetical protein